MERFNLKKLNEVEGKEQFRVEVSNRFAALEDLDAEAEISSAWEAIREKKHKTWFDEGCSKLLDLWEPPTRVIFGTCPLRSEFLAHNAHPVEPAHLITQLRQHMARLKPVPATRHASAGTFVHKDLQNCTHALLRQDATLRALEPSYSGPYQVLSRQEKTLKLLVRSKPVTVSTNRVKLAYIFNEVDFRNTVYNPAVKAAPHIAPPATPQAASSPVPPTRTTRSSRHVNTSTTNSAGGDVGTSHMSDIRHVSVALQRLVYFISCNQQYVTTHSMSSV
jgi:hypothetical protein